MLHIKKLVFGARNVKSRVNLGLGEVMTAWVVITRVVKGGQNFLLLRMGISLYQIFLKSTVYEISSLD